MGRRKDVSLEEKVSLVEEYLAGRLRLREAARRAGVGHTTMEIWISRYRSEGISALEENGNQCKRRYSEDFKRQAVEGTCLAKAAPWPSRKSIICAPGIWYWTG